jgi:hypothetical protein
MSPEGVIPLRVGIELNEDGEHLSIEFADVPIELLDEALELLAGPLRQQILDAVSGQLAANSLGLYCTRRVVQLEDGKAVDDEWK